MKPLAGRPVVALVDQVERRHGRVVQIGVADDRLLTFTQKVPDLRVSMVTRRAITVNEGKDEMRGGALALAKEEELLFAVRQVL